MRLRALSALIFGNFNVYKWENAYSKDLIAWKFLIYFYIFIKVKRWGGGGCTSACICMGTHSQPLLQNRLMDIYQIGIKYSWPRTFVLTFGPNPPRMDPGWGRNRSWGVPFRQRTYSSDRKATATKGMHCNYLEAFRKKCCYFWFHSEVKFLMRFWRLFGLSHFGVF